MRPLMSRAPGAMLLPLFLVALLVACGGEPEPGPVVTLPNGIMYRTLIPGDGDTVRVGDTITAHYTVWLADSTFVQSSKTERGGSGLPLTRPIGVGELIDGWDIAVPGMLEGEVRWLRVPYQYGYGEAGSPPAIPPRTDLIFEMEIVETRR
jgi:FKBP-type peptidyl-prolyl cis-trans isomerase